MHEMNIATMAISEMVKLSVLLLYNEMEKNGGCNFSRQINFKRCSHSEK
jgi:hypothetical protein